MAKIHLNITPANIIKRLPDIIPVSNDAVFEMFSCMTGLGYKDYSEVYKQYTQTLHYPIECFSDVNVINEMPDIITKAFEEIFIIRIVKEFIDNAYKIADESGKVIHGTGDLHNDIIKAFNVIDYINQKSEACSNNPIKKFWCLLKKEKNYGIA